MTAKEAREKASVVNSHVDSGVYLRIKARIGEEVRKGNFSLAWTKGMTDGMRAKLEEEGYIVTWYPDKMGGSYYLISW